MVKGERKIARLALVKDKKVIFSGVDALRFMALLSSNKD